MTHRKIFLLCMFCFSLVKCTTQSSEEIKCGTNEVLDECPVGCGSDKCPKSDGDYNVTCERTKSCPKPTCKCMFNYRRASNDTCIPASNCPPFPCTGPNEVFIACPPLCSDKCTYATPTGECFYFGTFLTVIECSPKCRCKQNYWRNNGVCVPYDECPKVLTASTVRSHSRNSTTGDATYTND